MEVFFCTDYSNFQEARGGTICHQGPKRTSYLGLKWARPKSILCCLRHNYMLSFISQQCQVWSKLSLSWLWICWSYYQIHWGLGNLLTVTLRKGGGRLSFQRINPQRYTLVFHGGLFRATANCEMCTTTALTPIQEKKTAHKVKFPKLSKHVFYCWRQRRKGFQCVLDLEMGAWCYLHCKRGRWRRKYLPEME